MERHEHEKVQQDPKEQAEHHHHMAAPEVEQRESHAYEGEGVGRRESLRGDDLPPAHAADEHAPGAAPQHGK